MITAIFLIYSFTATPPVVVEMPTMAVCERMAEVLKQRYSKRPGFEWTCVEVSR